MRQQFTLPPDVEERFWSRVDRSGGPDACWPWISTRTPTGYGQMTMHRRHYAAHRTAYQLANGCIKPNDFVCHSCDNPPCCNPAHLWAGRAKDNTRDMIAKGRYRHGGPAGDTHPRAKLTANDVREIRRRYAAGGITYAALAREFGTPSNNIRLIVLRQYWKHVE